VSRSPYTNQVAEPLEIIHIMQSKNSLPMNAQTTMLIAGPQPRVSVRRLQALETHCRMMQPQWRCKHT
jgi:hypothetical protein